MSNTVLSLSQSESSITMLDDNLIKMCMSFLTFVGFMNITGVNRYFHLQRTVPYIIEKFMLSFSFVHYDRLQFMQSLSRYRHGNGRISQRITWNPDSYDIYCDHGNEVSVDLFISVSAIAKLYWSYFRSVNFRTAGPIFSVVNDWIWSVNANKTLLNLRRAGCFYSRDVRRLLINHLSRFFLGGANEENSAQAVVVCNDEIVGEISNTMNLIPQVRLGSTRNVGIAVQFLRVLLTRSYKITYMNIDPVYRELYTELPVTGFFVDVDQNDVDRLNTVFTELYPDFVAIGSG